MWPCAMQRVLGHRPWIGQRVVTINGDLDAAVASGSKWIAPNHMTSCGRSHRRRGELVDANAIILGASAVSGTYAVTATTGDISNSGNLVITGAATFITTAADSNIILDQSGNAFTSTVTMQAGDGSADFGDITFVDSAAVRLHTSAQSAGDLYINATTDGAVDGNLSVTASGDITQTVALAVTGTTTLVASGNDITLDTSTNNFATVVITSGRNVALRDAGAIVLGAATVSGTYSVTAGGHITDSGTQEITGVTTLVAGGYDITLDTSTNNFAAAVVITSGRNVAITDEAAIVLGAATVSGTYAVTATTGDISNSGNLVITGAATFITTAADSNIILDQSGNAFTSTVTMQAGDGSADFGNITFVDSAAVRLHTSAQSAGDLYINATTDGAVDGNLSVTANGDITQTVALAVTGTTTLVAGGNDITLDTSTNNFATVVITSGRNVALRDAGAIVLGAATVSGTYSVTAGGHITDSGTQEITGVTTLVAGGYDITLDTSTNNFAAAVVITSGRNVAITDEAAIVLGASAVSGTYAVTATTGDISTDSGNLVITGAATFITTAADSNIILDQSGNAFTSTVTMQAGDGSADFGNITFVDSAAVRLHTSAQSAGDLYINATTDGAVDGNLSVTANGDITQTVALAVTGTTTLVASGNDITLDTSTNNFATVVITSGRNVALRDAGAIVLGAATVSGTYAVTATTGDISNSGNLVITGAATFITTAADSNIILDQSGNAFTSTVTMQAGDGSADFGNITFVDSAAVRLHTSAQSAGDLYINATTDGAVDGNLSVTANGDITQTVALAVTGTTTLVAGGNDITLDTSTNNFATVVITSGRNVALRDAGAIILGAATVSGTYSVTAGGGGERQRYDKR